MLKFAVTLLLLFSTQSYAADIQCIARVANRTYTVGLSTSTRVLTVSTDNGFKHIGETHYYHTPQIRYEIYALPAGHLVPGLDFRVDDDDGSYSICLSSSECYLCRAQ